MKIPEPHPRRPALRPAPPMALIVALVAAMAMTACAPGGQHAALTEIRDRGSLRVVTLNRPTSYYLGARGHEGLDFELAQDFATSLGLRLEMRAVANREGLQAALRAGEADIVAAHVAAGPDWSDAGLAARPHQRVRQVWVYRRGGTRPRSEADIPVQGRAVFGESGNDELDQLSHGGLGAVLIGDYEFAFARPVHPDLAIAFTAPVPLDVAWIVRRDGKALRDRVDAFMAEQQRSGALERRIAASLEAPKRVAASSMREFREHLSERLPALQGHFEHASVRTGLDWRLLAALGYQESQWRSDTVSSQGARGIMMLMPEVVTAERVRAVDDPRQNILAGARHLLRLRDRLPARIQEPDRTWFAIAAYNAGPGTLEDARIVTQIRGGNPDSWADVHDNLPLLAEEEWYTRVRNGYARGWETQYTVDRVRQYADLIAWRAANPEAPLSPESPGSSPETVTADSAAPQR